LVSGLSSKVKKLATMIGLQVRARNCRKSGAGGVFGAGNDDLVNALRTTTIVAIAESRLDIRRCVGPVTAIVNLTVLMVKSQSGCHFHWQTTIPLLEP
jgi:hypothetical protein